MRKPRAYDFSQLEERKAFYRSARWRNVRGIKLRRSPWCQRCQAEDKTTPATEVHHIVELKDRPDLALDFDNLWSTCNTCHLGERSNRG